MVASRGLFLAVTLAVMVSCGPGKPEPRAVRPESDACPECRMTVVPEGHAAEALDTEGRYWVFDDPGCLALYVHDHTEAFVGAAFFVQDLETKAWVAFDQASFVRADDVGSPMNYGWHAFSVRERAEAFAQTHAGTLASGGALAALAADLEGRRWRP